MVGWSPDAAACLPRRKASAFAADNGVLWVMLRPRANAAAASPDIVSIETVLFGVPTVRVYKQLGGRGGQ